MLALRLCDLLPPMTDVEAMETASVASHSARDQYSQLEAKTVLLASSLQLDGGVSGRRFDSSSGEISLAHNGLLFLDEMSSLNEKF